MFQNQMFIKFFNPYSITQLVTSLVNFFSSLRKGLSSFSSGCRINTAPEFGLQGDTDGVPVTKEEQHVTLLSGFSPFLLQSIMNGIVPDPFMMVKEIVSKYEAIVMDS
jgi:hypothetical protein